MKKLYTFKNKNSGRITKAVALILGLSLIVTACSLDFDYLTDDLVIYINSDIVDNPMSVQFVDANATNTDLPDEVSVKIVGGGGNQLYSMLGEREPEADGNILNLAVEKTNAISPENPLEFTVIAEAPGFAKGIRKYRIEHPDQLQLETFPMINKTAPPAGVSVEQRNFNIGTGGAATALTVSTSLDNGKQEKVDIIIPRGTKFYSAAGNELQGSARMEVIHYDTRNEISLESFPGGLATDSIIEMNGNAFEGGYFITAGFVSIDMFVGGEEVKDLSNPISVNVGIDENLINPNTGLTVLEGDEIPVWSLNEATMGWRQEGLANVIRLGGKLTASFKQDHFSYWNLDWWYSPRCKSTLTINSGIMESTANSRYILEFSVVNRSGQEIRRRTTALRFVNGEQLTLHNVPQPDPHIGGFYFRVYNGSNYYCDRGDMVYETALLSDICDGYTLDIGNALNATAPPQRVNVNLAFSGTCEGTDQDLAILPRMSIWYRDKSSGGCYSYFRYLTYMQEGEASFNRLQVGGTYDFMIGYAGFYSILPDITVPAESGSITVMDAYSGLMRELEFEYINANTIEMRYQNVAMPESVCEEWRRYFGG